MLQHTDGTTQFGSERRQYDSQPGSVKAAIDAMHLVLLSQDALPCVDLVKPGKIVPHESSFGQVSFGYHIQDTLRLTRTVRIHPNADRREYADVQVTGHKYIYSDGGQRTRWLPGRVTYYREGSEGPISEYQFRYYRSLSDPEVVEYHSTRPSWRELFRVDEEGDLHPIFFGTEYPARVEITA